MPEDERAVHEKDEAPSALKKIITTGFKAVHLIYFFTAGMLAPCVRSPWRQFANFLSKQKPSGCSACWQCHTGDWLDCRASHIWIAEGLNLLCLFGKIMCERSIFRRGWGEVLADQKRHKSSTGSRYNPYRLWARLYMRRSDEIWWAERAWLWKCRKSCWQVPTGRQTLWSPRWGCHFFQV